MLCLWFQKLAVEAEVNIENTDPPLFLRFINLLVNDAIFLLDEALDVSSFTFLTLCSKLRLESEILTFKMSHCMSRSKFPVKFLHKCKT